MKTLSLNDYSVMELAYDESALIIGGGLWIRFKQICGAIACLALICLVVAVVVCAIA